MIDIILGIALLLGSISQGPAAPTGPVPIPPTALDSAQ
jgi:hypothetical protein